MRTEVCPIKSTSVIRAHPNDGGGIKEIACGSCGSFSTPTDRIRPLSGHIRKVPESSIECEDINGRHGDITTVKDGREVCQRCGF